jgi:AraC family transcriptional activator of pobA
MAIGKAETLADFYSNRPYVLPGPRQEAGHFNVFRVSDFAGAKAQPLPFQRRDYYKITLALGNNRFTYADKALEIRQPALLFTNPLVPYQCERLDGEQHGYVCIFTDDFFTHFGHIKSYPLFRPGIIPVFYPTPAQVADLRALFEQLLHDLQSDYPLKYDAIRARVLSLMHEAMQMQPAEVSTAGPPAAARIAELFTELLQRQFPPASPQEPIPLRLPVDYARQLALHVNYLNRALKTATGKSTSQLLAERLVQEAVGLLRHTTWTVAEVGYSLGFEEPARFSAFFRKNTGQSPRHYRQTSAIVEFH